MPNCEHSIVYGVFNIVKAGILFIFGAGFFVSLSEVALAVENPVGLSTVPPSALHGGLFRSPKPAGIRGNLVITGNVGGGRHFRGTVPYNAGSDFGGRLGTGTLDSFLRYSMPPGRFAGRFTPFYSQTGTVTTMRLGRVGVVRPLSVRAGGRAADEAALPSLAKEQSLLSHGLSFPRGVVPSGRFGFTPTTASEAERAILGEVGTGAEGIKLPGVALEQARPRGLPEKLSEGEVPIEKTRESLLPGEDHKVEFEAGQFRQQLKQDMLEAERQRELADMRRGFVTAQEEKRTAEPGPLDGLSGGGESLLLRSRKITEADISQLLEIQEKTFGSSSQKGDEAATASELQKLRMKFDKVAPLKFRGDEFISAKVEADRTALRKQGGLYVYEEMGQEQDSLGLPRGAGPAKDFEDSYLVRREATGEILGISYEQQAKAIMCPYKTFASFSEAKFKQHLKVAEGYLKQGMYYRAADTYTLASVYKPKSPVACAGRSHALFAAGEYMSSALFLSRALEAFGEYEKELKSKGEEQGTADFNVFAFLAGNFTLIDRDKVESRVVDIEQWQQRSDSAELQFLLSYIYYQIGRGERAKEAVGVAHEKMPENQAVVMLKEAIDSYKPAVK